MKRAAIGVIAALSAAACATPNDAALPSRAGYAGLRDVAPARRGKVALYPDTFGDATPTGITTGPDGALWFTDPGNDVIGRMTTEGKYTLQVPAGAELSDGITVGPDGNVWFTVEQGGGGIGRVTPSGTVTLFADPGGEFTQGITTGPDGALWFAESNGTVGRSTTGGTVTHFTVAGSDAQLEGIVTGPDRNLWVTQYIAHGSRFSDEVLRVTTSGKVKAFKIGSRQNPAGPDNICVGPDKALWFTEANADALGRLTTGGKYREFPTGHEYAQPSGIATGPDGALWFTDFASGIARMTTSGKVKFYDVMGSGARITQITAGPNREMWFTSSFGPPALGRITTR